MAIILVLILNRDNKAVQAHSFLDYEDALGFFMTKIKEYYPNISRKEAQEAMRVEHYGDVSLTVTHPKTSAFL
jgi:hypothetical protein